MLPRFALVALVCGLLPVVSAETECVWKWRALGCTPSKECKLKWAPRFGSFGPCVLREPKEATPAESAPAESTSAAAAETDPPVEEPPATETAAPTEAAPEQPAEVPEEPAAKAEL